MARTQSSWLGLANLAEAEYSLFRRESLEFVYESIPAASGESNVRFSLAIGHESMVRIFGRMTLSTFAKLRISNDFNTQNFSFLGSIGATLNLMF